MKTELLFAVLFAFLLVLPNNECGRWYRRRRRYFGCKHVASRCYYTITRNCNYRMCWGRYCFPYCKQRKWRVCHAG